MGKSPGHQKWPNHRVEERHIGQRIKVEVGGDEIADSSDVIRVDEDDYPSRYYTKLEDAVWTYEEPYDDHRDLKDRLAFYDDKLKEIHVKPQPAQGA
jgi:uncharacterized protein (DUF427 family)